MITEISKFYIEGTGDPNDNVIIDSGYPNMPVNYYDVSTEPITEYKFDDTLEPGTKWFVTNTPIIVSDLPADSVGTGFVIFEGELYYWNGSEYVTADVPTPTIEVQHGLRILGTGEIEIGSDSATDAKGSQFLHTNYKFLNTYSDNWIGNSNANNHQILPVKNVGNVVSYFSNGDVSLNEVIVGRGLGNIDTNTMVGKFSLITNTTGYSNTSVGHRSLQTNTTGYENTAIGDNALRVINGTGNTAIGFSTLSFGGTASNNVAIGGYALHQNTGSSNIGIGGSVLFSNTGTSNIAIGNNALQRNTSGYQNTAIGQAALTDNTTGYYNTAIGPSALENNVDGYLNTAIGLSSMLYNISGNLNTAVGASTLFENTTGYQNTAVGRESSRNNTVGFNNASFGYATNQTNIGKENTAIGTSALRYATDADNNTAIGMSALANAQGDTNTAIGYQAAASLVTGTGNTILGSIDTPATLSNHVYLGSTGAVRLIIDADGNSDFQGTKSIKVPVGTTLERPTAVTGMIRFNTTTTKFEGYTGATWVDFHL